MLYGKLIRNWDKFQRYTQFLGTREALSLIFQEISKKERLRLITIANEEIYIRTNTPDLTVAINSLIEKEYENIHITDPKMIIDAGANIGTSAIFFAQKYPNATVLAVEPEQGNYNILLKNIVSFQNIIPIQAALWGTNDTKTIQNRFTGHWGYTIVNTDKPVESTGQQIECITMMDLIEKYNIDCIDILKMDIEGGEKSVFDTAENWINKVKVITVELHERIRMGCEKSFYLATKEFSHFEKNGEKITAYS
ncbi:MAG: FkbM family methyltransferase [Calothrix sp. MO_192.B10]|nr:FkbM family methyltransferase [Calothrix sp. MO_192.B10]